MLRLCKDYQGIKDLKLKIELSQSCEDHTRRYSKHLEAHKTINHHKLSYPNEPAPIQFIKYPNCSPLCRESIRSHEKQRKNRDSKSCFEWWRSGLGPVRSRAAQLLSGEEQCIDLSISFC